MTTQHVHSPHAAPARSMLESVRDTFRWVREAPAPRWEGDTRDKATFVGYVAASMVAWTLLGLLVTAALGRLISVVG